MNIYQDILLFFGALLLMIVLSGCDDRTINGYEDEEGIFSVYGALDVDETRHVIRVRNLLEPFQSHEEIDNYATVTFFNLETGAKSVLQDSVIQFTAGKVHNYILKHELEPSTQYQLIVERADGAKVTTNMTTPAITNAYFEPEKIFTCEEPIYFYFENVEPREFIGMEVGVMYRDQELWAPIRIVGEFEYDKDLKRVVLFMRPRHLLVEIFPPSVIESDPNFNPYNLRPRVTCDDLEREFFMFRYIHYGPEWEKAKPIKHGPIDTDSGDIENGLGFLGAYHGGRFSFEFE